MKDTKAIEHEQQRRNADLAAEMREAMEPERDDLPSTVFVVLGEMGIPVFCAAYPQACHDHISDAIVEHEIHSAGLWVVREYTLDPRTRSQKLADAGFTRRPSLRVMDMREALELIAAPMRPDGTWNRDREACRELAAEALGRYDDDPMPHGHQDITDADPGPRPLQDAMTVRNACPRGYNRCGFDAKAQACVAAECPKTPNAEVRGD